MFVLGFEHAILSGTCVRILKTVYRRSSAIESTVFRDTVAVVQAAGKEYDGNFFSYVDIVVIKCNYCGLSSCFLFPGALGGCVVEKDFCSSMQIC